jgi:predicted RecB family nuclease
MNLKAAASAPFSPVGWSKCNGCGYRGHCWPGAEQRRDVALVYGVDQGLVLTLRDDNIVSYEDLLEQHDQATLAEIKRHWGKGLRRVGKSAEKIMPMARALASGTESILETPNIPESANYVMFDLEGLPPYLNELQKIYLWGIQVFGQQPSEFLPALSSFGRDGDREGWDGFLSNASKVFSDYGDIPFVHWHHYEATNLKMYVDRYGDPDGIADRLKENLVDLLPITQRSVALPISSYSLKVIEQYIGYERTQDEYGGEWAMAKYIEATETDDENLREEVMNTILEYNREDLEATWAVLTWLKSKKA